MGPMKGIKRGKYSTRSVHPFERLHCWKCNASYKRKYALLDHIRATHLKLHEICCLCNKMYISVSVLNRHLRDVHNIKNPTIPSKVQSIPDPISQAATDTCRGISRPLQNLEFDTNKAYPGMADILSFKKNITYGRHIISDADIDVGRVILATQDFASIEYLSSIDSCCFNCGKAKNNFFVKCQFCINVWFCSKRCSLNEIHSLKCNRAFQCDDSHIVRLATEIIRVGLEKFSDNKRFIDFCHGLLLKK